MPDVRESYFSQFEKLGRRSPGQWLQPVRKAAIDAFGQIGFPTSRNEDWKYTNVGHLSGSALALAEGSGHGPHAPELATDLPFATEDRLVFVNGRYQASLSKLARLPKGCVVERLSAALATESDALALHLGRHASFADHPFVALNTAFFDEGVFIRIPEGVVLDAPLHLVFLSEPARPMRTVLPRILIVAERASQAKVVETYLPVSRGDAGTGYFTNAVTEIVVGKGASLEHTKLQQEGLDATHIATVQVDQDRDSRFTSHFISLGSMLARNELKVVLGGEGAECALNGLYFASGRQHLDNATFIDHAKARCTSRELYKGILEERASGVFSGRVLVREGAAKTDASQTNKNLLLSDDATVDSKPQLAIYADDVKCTHGATVGQLDDQALFYLRSRGLDRDMAQSLLTYAFASEVVERIGPEAIRARVRERLTSKLPGADMLGEGR